MAQRQKRSISLPADLAAAIDQAATAEGTTVSAWIADTAAHRLRIDAGRKVSPSGNANTAPSPPTSSPMGSPERGQCSAASRHAGAPE
ncbi:MAG: hypothetical protein HY828_21205 [Actinobacteria bacterium]|nr:hypothetical protein [Actinomycetota bacterium]